MRNDPDYDVFEVPDWNLPTSYPGTWKRRRLPLGIRIAIGVILALFAINFLGCVTAVGPNDVVGEFELRAINNQALPYVVGKSENGPEMATSEILAGRLFLEGATYLRTLRFRTTVTTCYSGKCETLQAINVETLEGGLSIEGGSNAVFFGETNAVLEGGTLTVFEPWPNGGDLALRFQRVNR